MVCPETDSAVHTMPAIAMTKNIPAWPLMPNRSSTTDEMMTVSMVMPDTGLRAVVAIAVAATDVKKNEKTSVSSESERDVSAARQQRAEEDRDGGRRNRRRRPAAPSPGCRDRCARRSRRRDGTPVRRWRTTRATIRSDLMMPKIPAVAMAPTPMNRT